MSCNNNREIITTSNTVFKFSNSQLYRDLELTEMISNFNQSSNKKLYVRKKETLGSDVYNKVVLIKNKAGYDKESKEWIELYSKKECPPDFSLFHELVRSENPLTNETLFICKGIWENSVGSMPELDEDFKRLEQILRSIKYSELNHALENKYTKTELDVILIDQTDTFRLYRGNEIEDEISNIAQRILN